MTPQTLTTAGQTAFAVALQVGALLGKPDAREFASEVATKEGNLVLTTAEARALMALVRQARVAA